MSMRAVVGTADLGGFTFNQGDEVVCMTRTVHLDPEIHERPDEYIPTRYMTEKKFTKNGRPVVNHSIPWGGGVSMCEGRWEREIDSGSFCAADPFVFLSRHFAQKEMKSLITLLLMKYSIEADPMSAERPSFLEGRMGVGAMHPKGDIRVIIRRRE